MKQEKVKTHKQYNGTNTPLDDLNDDLGMVEVNKMIFHYAGKQFDPRDTNSLGHKYDLRERYGGAQ